MVASWPVEVEQIALIGHSMGGLVARSACHHGGDWTALVRHTVSLGTPHSGAPLEQAVHAMSAALHLVPETRPFARFLRRRSAGIRDLRRGSLVDEDWRDQDPDALRSQGAAPRSRCSRAPPTASSPPPSPAARRTRSAACSATRSCSPRAPPAAASASPRTTASTLGGTHHLALLNHPEVYDRLRSWL